MPLPSFLRRPSASASDPDPAWPGATAAEQQARAQARRRLIGAVVLLGLGVLLFPWLFETQPRSLPADVPIQVARRDAGQVVTVPAVPAGETPVTAPAAELPVVPAPPAAVPPQAEEPPAARVPTPTPTPAPAPASAPVRSPAPGPAPAPATSPAQVRAPAPASAPAAVPRAAAPSAVQPASAPRSATIGEPPPGQGRFVIQVGAYSDPVALREARARVERLGLSTYTQVIDTEAGRRTRVRVGPFETREQADSAAARLKLAGLPAYILTP